RQEGDQLSRQAIESLAKLVTEVPNRSDFRWWLNSSFDGLAKSLKAAGRELEAKQVYLQVIAPYESLVAANPKEALYHCGLGQLYAWSGQSEKATVEFAQAIKLQPDRWQFWHWRGHNYLNPLQADKA